MLAEINGSNRCLESHTAAGRLAGLGPAEIGAARRAEADSRAAALLRLTRDIAIQRGRVAEADLTDARRAGVGDAEIIEIVAHVRRRLMAYARESGQC